MKTKTKTTPTRWPLPSSTDNYILFTLVPSMNTLFFLSFKDLSTYLRHNPLPPPKKKNQSRRLAVQPHTYQASSEKVMKPFRDCLLIARTPPKKTLSFPPGVFTFVGQNTHCAAEHLYNWHFTCTIGNLYICTLIHLSIYSFVHLNVL